MDLVQLAATLVGNWRAIANDAKPSPDDDLDLEVMARDRQYAETLNLCANELDTALRACADALAPPEPGLTFAQFSAVNRQRCQSPDGFNHRLDSWSTSDWFLATLGELGEAANNAKKLNRYRDGIPGNKESESALRDKLRKELGDVYVYLDLMAQSLGVDIGAAAVEVFNAKSEEIGCPIRMLRADALAPPEPPEALKAVADLVLVWRDDAADLRRRCHEADRKSLDCERERCLASAATCSEHALRVEAILSATQPAPPRADALATETPE